MKKQTGRDPIVAICWLWTTHSLLFTQLPANMCISISHFFLELISGLNHNHMKDDFSKAAAFQNLVCASNVACLFWSHCFYWTFSLNYCEKHPTLSAVPVVRGLSANHLIMKKSRKALVKRCFSGSLSAFLSYSKTDLIPYIHFTGKMSHLVSTMWWRRYWLWRFQAAVKTLFNWKNNPSILKETKSKCSRKTEEL